MPTVLITGANGSIGCELAKLYANRGDKVVAVCRHNTELIEQAKGEFKADQITIVKGLELDKPHTMGEFIGKHVGEMKHKYDLVIHNAGVLFAEDGSAKLPDLAADKITESLTTNAVSPLLLTTELLKHNMLTANAKVVLVTSRMGSIDDNGSGGYYGYRMSKCALNMAGKCLALDLKPQGIAVGLLHPGYVKTKMTNWQGHIDAQESARLLSERIEHDLTLETTGGFWHCNGEKLPW